MFNARMVTATLGKALLVTSAATALSGVLAATPATAQLPHEQNGVAECGHINGPMRPGQPLDDRTVCRASVGTRVVEVYREAINTTTWGVSANTHDTANENSNGYVNLDRCTKDSIEACDADPNPSSWETKDTGWMHEPQPIHSEEMGIFRACGAPIGEGQKWLCTGAIRVS